MEKNIEKNNATEKEMPETVPMVDITPSEAVASETAAENTIIEHDAFEHLRNRDDGYEYHRDEETSIFGTPLYVQRIASNGEGGRVYYNYAVAYKTKINGKEIAQTINLQPGEKRADIYDLLDAIFGDADRSKLYISRTSRTSTVNGVSRVSYAYSCQVRAEDEFGVEFSCGLVPSGNGGRTKFTNLLSKLKSMGIVD